MNIQDRAKSERLETERRKAIREATLNRVEELGIDWQSYTDSILLIANELDDSWDYGLEDVTDELPVPTDPDFGTAVEEALSTHLSNLHENVRIAIRSLKELEVQINHDKARLMEKYLRSDLS